MKLKTNSKGVEMASVESMAGELERRYGIHWAMRKSGPDAILVSNNKASVKLGDMFPDVFQKAMVLAMAAHSSSQKTTPVVAKLSSKDGPSTKGAKKQKARPQPVVGARTGSAKASKIGSFPIKEVSGPFSVIESKLTYDEKGKLSSNDSSTERARKGKRPEKKIMLRDAARVFDIRGDASFAVAFI
jgi:hypothetical protein